MPPEAFPRDVYLVLSLDIPSSRSSVQYTASVSTYMQQQAALGHRVKTILIEFRFNAKASFSRLLCSMLFGELVRRR